MKEVLEHVKAFGGLFASAPNRSKNEQFYLSSSTSLETIADYFQEQQDRVTTEKDFQPAEGMECVRQYLILYLNNKVDDIDPKGNEKFTGQQLIERRVNGWFKPTEASATVSSLNDRISILTAIVEANDEKEASAKNSEEYKAADALVIELKAKLATM
tara:strand:- start:698 stop:1171 length:474 start_codon:yes stop_codon:yes gene_type:complete